jgi:hypothetical protein
MIGGGFMQKDDELAPIYFTVVGIGLDIDGISQSLGMSPTHSHHMTKRWCQHQLAGDGPSARRASSLTRVVHSRPRSVTTTRRSAKNSSTVCAAQRWATPPLIPLARSSPQKNATTTKFPKGRPPAEGPKRCRASALQIQPA